VAIPIEDLLRGYPVEVAKFLKYVRELRFDQRPNYTYLTNLITSAISKCGPNPCGDYRLPSTPNTTTTTTSSKRGGSDAQDSQQQWRRRRHDHHHHHHHHYDNHAYEIAQEWIRRHKERRRRRYRKRHGTDYPGSDPEVDAEMAAHEVFDWNVRALELCDKGESEFNEQSLSKWSQTMTRERERERSRKTAASMRDSGGVVKSVGAASPGGNSTSPGFSWYKPGSGGGGLRTRTTRSSSQYTARQEAIQRASRQMLSYAEAKKKDLVLQGKYPSDGESQGAMLQRHRKIRLMTYLLSLAMAFPNHPILGAFHMGAFDSSSEEDSDSDSHSESEESSDAS
jgi:hypothetical protein